MDAKAADQEGSGSKIKKRPDTWELPKIPVNQVYKKKSFRIFPCLHQNPRYVIKDFEKTITLDFTSKDNGCKSFKLIDEDFMDGFLKKQHNFVHWGLVQVAIKPLARDGLEAPIIVCLRDGRLLYWKNSLLAMVETDLSNGPFYFNCFPSYLISCNDIFECLVLALNAKTSGIPLAITYRIVCKAMGWIDSEALPKEITVGKTTYFQGNSKIPVTTEWDEVQVPQEWTTTTHG